MKKTDRKPKLKLRDKILMVARVLKGTAEMLGERIDCYYDPSQATVIENPNDKKLKGEYDFPVFFREN